MSYIIYNSDGTVVAVIPENVVDSESTSLDLIGKNLDNYGQYLNSNFFKLLTNFSSNEDNEPRSPQIGQLWYDTTSKRIKVYNGLTFVSAFGAYIAGTEPPVKFSGDLWFDSINGQLKLWDGNSFELIGPAVSKVNGKFGIEPPLTPILSDDLDVVQKVGVVFSYSSPTMLLTTASFSMKASDSLTYFGVSNVNQINEGITILDDLSINGNLRISGHIASPVNWLSTYFDITQYGDILDDSISTSTRLNMYYDANNAIRFELLKVFPKNSFSNQAFYAPSSRAKVVCNLSRTLNISTTTDVALVGTNTIYVSTASLSIGNVLLNDNFIKKSTTITSIGNNFIRVAPNLITSIPQGTNIHFYEDVPSVRAFSLQELIPGSPQWEPTEIFPSASSPATGTCVLLSSNLEATISNVAPASFMNEISLGMQLFIGGPSVGVFGQKSLITNIDKTLNEIRFKATTPITPGVVDFYAQMYPFINTSTNIVR